MILDAWFSFFFYLSSSSFFSPIAPLNFYFFHIFYDLYCAFCICMLFSPFVPLTIFWFKVDILQKPPSFLTSLLYYYSLVLPCCSPTYSLIHLIFFTFFEAQTIHLLHSFFSSTRGHVIVWGFLSIWHIHFQKFCWGFCLHSSSSTYSAHCNVN